MSESKLAKAINIVGEGVELELKVKEEIYLDVFCLIKRQAESAGLSPSEAHEIAESLNIESYKMVDFIFDTVAEGIWIKK